MLKRWFALALAGAGCIAASAAPAADLGLQEAVRRSVERNAVLRAENSAVTGARHQAELDGLAPALTVGTELENLAGTGDLSGTQGVETTLRLGRVIELGGKQSARQSLGAAQVGRQLNVAEQRRLDLAADVAHRFIAVVSTQAVLDLAEQGLALARSSRSAIADRVARGRSPTADLDLADLAVIRAELDQEDATHELASARVALSVLWGETQPGFERAAGQLEDLPRVATFEALADRLPSTPDQQAFALERGQIEAQQRVASAAARPDLHTTIGVRHLESIDDQALVFSLSMPLGASKRSSLARDKLKAEAERLDARQALTSLDAYQLLFARYQELEHARHEVETLRGRMIPLAERAVASAEQGYEEARFSFLQVTQARALTLDLERDAINAAARYHHLLADIERATAVSGETTP